MEGDGPLIPSLESVPRVSRAAVGVTVVIAYHLIPHCLPLNPNWFGRVYPNGIACDSECSCEFESVDRRKQGFHHTA